MSQEELDLERLQSSKLQEQLNSAAANATAAATAAAAVSIPEELQVRAIMHSRLLVNKIRLILGYIFVQSPV